MKIIMKLLGPIAPAALIFGPLMMVMNPGARDSNIAAVGLSLGLFYMLRTIHSLRDELEEIRTSTPIRTWTEEERV